ncbi:vacuolar protein 14 C-terminal Fig4p binding-domain-containing protein [Umbelopsis sp. PMI_123]|nr:vacuolar protein 14 C-terminal Fig4p binding-domain-containing protein [Umbelopsis sp. PMI_123]
MDSSIFPLPVIRGLTDRLYDKRKAAALEIEKLARENAKSPERMTQIIDTLVQDFVYSNNPNARNGGLIGLAATAIALGSAVVAYLDIIVAPVLSCFTNQDPRVRYYACESMYNIAKVAKGDILRYFNSVFDGMCKLAADTESSVKSGAELLDRLVKDIVSELSTKSVAPDQPPLNPPETDETLEIPGSLPRNTAFSLPLFIPLLSERIYTQNSAARQFLVSWISVLDSIPDLELVSFLPEFLDGFLNFLNDPSQDVKVSTNVLLSDFLREIKAAAHAASQEKSEVANQATDNQTNDQVTPGEERSLMMKENQTLQDVLQTSGTDHVDAPVSESEGVGKELRQSIQILIPHLSDQEEDIQNIALQWINEFIGIAPDIVMEFTPQIITSVLPLLAHDGLSIKSMAIETNRNLQSSRVDDPSLSPQVDPFDYQKTVSELRLQFLNENEETRVASLEWLLMLHKKAPSKILASDDGTFPALLKTLSDSSEEVVRRDLQLLAQISFHSDHEYFRGFMVNLLSLFSTDRRLLETRGSLIIRQLCVSLDAERIYGTLADILEKDEDLEFASIMVQNLNIILITSSELADLRKRLKNLDTRDGQQLFTVLYRSWCHSAVATFSLCLLAQAYEHAANMLQVFAELEISVNMLIQIDKLVQLLESPVFTYLRLQLLEPDRYPYLFKCLYGILMLLPQSSAFSTLRNRLSSVSSLGFLNVMPKNTPEPAKRQSSKSVPGKQDEPSIKFQDLLVHFKNVQARHEKFRRQGRVNANGFLLTYVLQNVARGAASRNRRVKDRMSKGSSAAPLPSGYSGSSQGASSMTSLLNRPDARDRANEIGNGQRPSQERSSSATRSSSPPGGRVVGRSRPRKA